ncbi:hypothetical protein K1719_017707 [Acacia pycnantha]|nr:hypothetical protein K1719_017707 [Acacia pycnantha]
MNYLYPHAFFLNTLEEDVVNSYHKLFPRAPIINKFEDVAYNRVGYTVVCELAPVPSSEPCDLRSSVSAFDNIDFEMHCGTHPRLGLVDHICCHPLADASLNQAAETARLLASDVGSNLQVPVFLYGAAHEEGRPLDSIRRALGYFKPNSCGNQWVGGPKSNFLTRNPDSGPSQVSPSKGVVVIGAAKWVENYNTMSLCYVLISMPSVELQKELAGEAVDF